MYVCICMLYECFNTHVTDPPPLRFLRLNTTPGVTWVLLPAEDEGVSGAISPPGGFRIFDETYSSFYVRANITCNVISHQSSRVVIKKDRLKIVQVVFQLRYI